MNKTLFTLSLAACSTLGLIAGCNTWNGVKEDVRQGDGAKPRLETKSAPTEMKTDPNPLGKADSQMTVVLNKLESLGGKPIELLEPAQARKQPTMTDAVQKVMKDRNMDPSDDDGVSTDNTSVTGPDDKKVKVRVYRPKNAGDAMLPVIVYVHGGGWVIASVDVYDASCRAMAKMTTANVVSVDYDLAPEYKYPAAHDEVYSVLQWALHDAEQIKGDKTKVAIMGESAGGNLAAAACVRAKAHKGLLPLAQVLVYPIASDKMDSASYIEEANAKPLNKAMMAWFFKYTFANPSDATSDDINLVGLSKDKLVGLPPATVINAQIDPLRSEGEQYAANLKAAGVDVVQKTYPGVTHEFFGAGKVLDKAMDAENLAATRLKEAFAK